MFRFLEFKVIVISLTLPLMSLATCFCLYVCQLFYPLFRFRSFFVDEFPESIRYKVKAVRITGRGGL
jgi:hypothetical protein